MLLVDVSVVVPVFDEVESLPQLADELTAALSNLGRWEVVFVDDGSRDGSTAVLADLARHRPGFRTLRFGANRGQSAALAAGLGAARGRVVVTLDSDLQNDPADIPRVVEALAETRADIVSGIRASRRDTWARRVASRVANLVRDGVLHDGVSDVGCSLKAYRAELLRDLPAFDGLHRFLPALLAGRGARIVELSVSHRARRYGTSKYGIGRRLWRGLWDLVGVRWLLSRQVELAAVEEISWTSTPSGSSSAFSARASSSDASSSSGSPPSVASRA
jgi:dolichol-phosphate mannosyltransferase